MTRSILGPRRYFLGKITNWPGTKPESMLSSNPCSGFSMVLFYSTYRSDSLWFINYTPSILSPNFCKSPLNNYIFVIQSSKFFVASYISRFASLLCNILLELLLDGISCLTYPMNIKHYHWVSLQGLIIKISKIIPLYMLFFSSYIMMSYLIFSSTLSTGFLTASLGMISYPISPTLSNNLPEHIPHCLIYPLNLIILMLIYSILF